MSNPSPQSDAAVSPSPSPPIKVWTLMGLPVHRRLRTGDLQVPWDSVFLLSLVWFTFGFHMFAGGQAITFTIQQYNRDPQIIALIGTVSFAFMIGPIISYLSDTVWTPIGRRLPFILVAWLGGATGMFSLAFFPEVCLALDEVLGWVGLPSIAPIVILTGIIFCYKKAWDFTSPLEPLFVECVPSNQRGRFFAIRGILFTLATMFFFQVLWPFYDDRLDIFGCLGFPNQLFLKGETLIYLAAGSLCVVTGFYLFFCIEETLIPTAPNKSFKELFIGTNESLASRPERRFEGGWKGFWEVTHRIPIVNFVVGFVGGIATRAYWPFYLLFFIPQLELQVWGGFSALMLNDQFGYSKANQSLQALPLGILTMCLITPFAGWYSDVRIDLKWRYRIILLILSAVGMIGAYWLFQLHAPADIRELPPLWVLFAITGLLCVALIALFVPLIETMLDWVGREHARAWVSILVVLKKLIIVAATYWTICVSPDHVPSILIWMVFFVLNGALDALLRTFSAPMLYDYIRRSNLGTIGGGHVLIDNMVSLIAPNIGAWWVVFYTATFVAATSGKGGYDYSSIYILQLVLFIPALLVKAYFVWLVVKKKIPKVGGLEDERTA